MRIFLPIALFAVTACDTVADIETDDSFSAAPDIAGSYTVAITGASGCTSNDAVDAFAGTLTVSGDADALSFAFENGESVPGSVDDSFFFEFGGTVGAGNLFADGAASESAELWTLSGDFGLTLADDACEVVAEFTANEVAR